MQVRYLSSKLSPAKDRSDLQLHCAALEWSLAEPIIINSADDIKSSVDWQDRLQPFHHQVQNLMRFCRRLPVTLLADDVGLGKTISAGLILAELMKRGRVSRAFVICPKILIPQWVEELDAKFGISSYGAVGSELRSAERRSESVIVTTYQSATGFLQRREPGLFDMMILDEAHKVRNLHGTRTPPKMATAVFKALESRMFKYVVMLTATPIQNRLWDIYSLIDCLAVARGHKNPFGPPSKFAQRFIADSKSVARHLNQRNSAEFRQIVNSYMFRTRRIDAKLVFPKREVQTNSVKPTAEERSIQTLLAKHIHEFTGLMQSSLLVALMSSPQALVKQLANMAEKGNASPRLVNEVRQISSGIERPAKSRVVIDIAKKLKAQSPRWRMVVFTTRKETQQMLGDVLAKEAIPYGFISGGQPSKNRETIASFQKPDPDVNVIVSTDAGAEGVNLQSANILVNYDLPWNPMIVEQRIGRVQRIGSKFKTVWVANVVHRNSPEEKIVVRLMEKLQVISHTVGDIECVLEATDDADGQSLEKQIREMVVASLVGQDQTEATRKAEQSIENARRLIEENQDEMDRTFGGLEDAEETDIPMPRLSIKAPSMPIQNFVISALTAEGAEVVEEHQGLFSARSKILGEERFTFDQRIEDQFSQPGVFMGRRPMLYQPGKPIFERLVQRWIERSATLIEDERDNNERTTEICRQWVHSIPQASMSDVRVETIAESFRGRIVCRTRVANSIDSFEKLIEFDFAPDDLQPDANTNLGGVVVPEKVVPGLKDRVIVELSRDADVGKFRSYYESRLHNELKSTDSGARRAKLENDLFPSVSVETVALIGALKNEIRVSVGYEIDGEVFESDLLIRGGEVADAPPQKECSITGMTLPVDCLEQCSFSGKLALRGKLVESEESGRLTAPENTVLCEVSNKRIHLSERGKCGETGKLVAKSALATSDISGRTVLKKFARECDLTGATLLLDEIETSSITGKCFRKDESVTLAGGQQLAHQSEATQCAYSERWFSSKDVVFSEVTGKAIGPDRVGHSEFSGRVGDISELAKCEQTGRLALLSELCICEVSGKQVHEGLVKKCPECGRTALEALFKQCETTGVEVLPECLEKSVLSGKVIRKSLLAKSGVSGDLAERQQLVSCQSTGILLLPDEVGTCEITGKRVDKRLLKPCAKSGNRVLQSEMNQSDATGNWFLKALTERLPNGTLVGVGEVVVCCWSSKYVLATNSFTCKICGLTFDKALVNDRGEFGLLRECLDGAQKGRSFPDPGYLARIQPDLFGGVVAFRWISSASNNTHILFGKKAPLIFNPSYFAVFASGPYQQLRLANPVVWGKRKNSRWSLSKRQKLPNR